MMMAIILLGASAGIFTYNFFQSLHCGDQVQEISDDDEMPPMEVAVARENQRVSRENAILFDYRQANYRQNLAIKNAFESASPSNLQEAMAARQAYEAVINRNRLFY